MRSSANLAVAETKNVEGFSGTWILLGVVDREARLLEGIDGAIARAVTQEVFCKISVAVHEIVRMKHTWIVTVLHTRWA